MRLTILHNRDHAVAASDPGRAAREDVLAVSQAMEQALKSAGHDVTRLGVDADLRGLFDELERRRPDVCLNLCESLAADSRGELVVPAVLDVLGVPYTGSGPLALGMALHKDKAKGLLRAFGVPTPDFQVVSRVEELVDVRLRPPLIVKPSREDASAGIDFDCVVSDRRALGRAVGRVLKTFHQPALVERFVDGREVYVPILGNAQRRALPLTEIHFGAAFAGKPKVLSYTAKWAPDSPECRDSPARPAQLSPALERRCVEVALAAFAALECRDYGRVDLRVDGRGRCHVIEVNPNCDLHPDAGFANAAAAAGIAYADLAQHLVSLALERRHGNQAPDEVGPAAARRAAATDRDLQPRRGVVRARAHRHRSGTGQH